MGSIHRSALRISLQAMMKMILVAALLVLGLSEVCCFFGHVGYYPWMLPSYGMLGYGGFGYGKGYGGYGKGYGGYGKGYGGIGDGKGYGYSRYKRSTDSYSPAPRHETIHYSSPVVVDNHAPDAYSSLHYTFNSYAPSHGYSSYSAPSHSVSSHSAPSYSVSSHSVPSYGYGSHSAPSYSVSSHSAPSYSVSSHSPPSYGY